MWRVRLINNYTKPCCGNPVHSEVLVEWDFDTLMDAIEFYLEHSEHYGEESGLGEYLAKPEEVVDDGQVH